jgi:hypothetical protein
MWIFLSAGMMMPALIPPSVLAEAKTPEIKEAVERGWELQIRGRVREHLEHFIENYMPEDSCSKVYESEDKDYNVRAYTTREAFGRGLMEVSLNIDYVKFKDTAENFPWGKRYHDLLLRVWGASTMLGRPYSGEKKYVRRKQVNKPGKKVRIALSDYDYPERKKSIHELSDDELEKMWLGA